MSSSGHQTLKALVEQFAANIDRYKSHSYDETTTRIDFINKFFGLLAWDMDNTQGYSEDYRDVVHEDSVTIENHAKAPDYSFRIGGQRKFFVEAKKPSVNIKEAQAPAFQVRRYGYTAKLPLSILTDFEEFAVYDTRIKPNKNDKASVARVFYCRFEEYEEKWDEIEGRFSKEAILKGSFDRYVEENKGKKGTGEVDKEFLKMIEGWRSEIARTLALRNKDLDVYELNYAVTKIIDRIIFLRIAEDRHTESYGTLRELAEKQNVYQAFDKICRDADEKYNSGLFQIEGFLSNLKVDDKVLSKIFKGLYYPDCPYEFSVLGVEILGQIYEQFLGKTIRLTKGHQAKIEEKPEVRKAGGVYYTPQYIVDYIVKNTVGEKLKGLTPAKASDLKICDPACGSGSFLIGAYDYLLKWHLEYYTNPKRRNKALKDAKIYEVNKTTWRLTIREKRRILLNSIFGVDIDRHAVEVTKLSLLLKLMENENQESVGNLFKESQFQILPDLSSNIKCGNSLIGSDFYDGQNFDLFDDDQIRKINVFDWEDEFPDIFEKGGFDIVIGNPPYAKERDNKKMFRLVKKGRLSKYHQGKMDYWYFFVHQALNIIKTESLIGFITNSYFLQSAGSKKLIQRIRKEGNFNLAVYFGGNRIFQKVAGKHIIQIIEKNPKNKNKKIKFLDASQLKDFQNFHLEKTSLLEPDLVFTEDNKILFSNLKKLPFRYESLLAEGFETSNGIQESTDKVSKKALKKYGHSKKSQGDGVFVLTRKELTALGLNKNEKKHIFPYLNTHNVKRYHINFENQFIIYSDKQVKELIGKNLLPNLKKHLDTVRPFITSSNAPYGLHRPRKKEFFEEEKIICKGMFKTPEFTVDKNKYFVGFSFSLIKETLNSPFPLKVLLALLNSKFANYWFHYNCKKRGVGVDVGVQEFRKFPLPHISPQNQITLTEYVSKMLNIKAKLNQTKTEADSKMFNKLAKALDKKIDQLVYELYGLNEEEIKIIEKETAI